VSLFDAYVWIQANWKSLGWPVAVLFAFLWWNKTTPCPEAPVSVTQTQGATEKVVNRTVTKLVPQYVYVPGEAPRPLPCPAIEVTTDMGIEATHWQSQQVTQTPQIATQPNVLGVFVGGGYLSTPIATLGLYSGQWRVGALASTTAIGGLASYDIRF